MAAIHQEADEKKILGVGQLHKYNHDKCPLVALRDGKSIEVPQVLHLVIWAISRYAPCANLSLSSALSLNFRLLSSTFVYSLRSTCFLTDNLGDDLNFSRFLIEGMQDRHLPERLPHFFTVRNISNSGSKMSVPCGRQQLDGEVRAITTDSNQVKGQIQGSEEGFQTVWQIPPTNRKIPAGFARFCDIYDAAVFTSIQSVHLTVHPCCTFIQCTANSYSCTVHP
eukprot:Gb_29109 [translate_table: standard]